MPRREGLSQSFRFSAKLLRNCGCRNRGTVVQGRNTIFDDDSEGVVHLGAWRLIPHLSRQGTLTLSALDSNGEQKDARTAPAFDICLEGLIQQATIAGVFRQRLRDAGRGGLPLFLTGNFCPLRFMPSCFSKSK
jgi:hypothetical protein